VLRYIYMFIGQQGARFALDTQAGSPMILSEAPAGTDLQNEFNAFRNGTKTARSDSLGSRIQGPHRRLPRGSDHRTVSNHWAVNGHGTEFGLKSCICDSNNYVNVKQMEHPFIYMMKRALATWTSSPCCRLL
jgi:hypothetical protein